MKHSIMIAAAACAASLFTPAAAHPGPKLLTTGSGERTAMTSGVSYADFDGVHLFKGTMRVAEAVPTSLMGGATKRVYVTTKTEAPFRSFRTLRTQGFYSGTAPLSRRYSQGFYSGE